MNLTRIGRFVRLDLVVAAVAVVQIAGIPYVTSVSVLLH